MIPSKLQVPRTLANRPSLAVLAALGCAAAWSVACPPASRAQAQAEAGKAVVGKDYALAHKSVYTPTGSPRSPFWPIGWTPSAPTTEAPVAAATVKPEDFVVTSISMDYPPLAVINKRTYSVGERVPLAGGDTVTVRQISDGVVVLDHHGKLLRVGTGTPSLNTPKKTP